MDTSMINKIHKSKEYAEQPERATFHSLTLVFRGDNSNYTMSLGPEGWSCTCPGFQKYGICPHIMTVEKMFKPVLKRDPLPYAPGQNIVSDVKKAKRYSEEPERIRILNFQATWSGDNKEHRIEYDNGVWKNETSSFFNTRGISTHVMAMERILKGMVEPHRVQPANVTD